MKTERVHIAALRGDFQRGADAGSPRRANWSLRRGAQEPRIVGQVRAPAGPRADTPEGRGVGPTACFASWKGDTHDQAKTRPPGPPVREKESSTHRGRRRRERCPTRPGPRPALLPVNSAVGHPGSVGHALSAAAPSGGPGRRKLTLGSRRHEASRRPRPSRQGDGRRAAAQRGARVGWCVAGGRTSAPSPGGRHGSPSGRPRKAAREGEKKPRRQGGTAPFRVVFRALAFSAASTHGQAEADGGGTQLASGSTFATRDLARSGPAQGVRRPLATTEADRAEVDQRRPGRHRRGGSDRADECDDEGDTCATPPAGKHPVPRALRRMFQLGHDQRRGRARLPSPFATAWDAAGLAESRLRLASARTSFLFP